MHHHHHHHHLIIKAAELVSVFEAEIDHPLGLLKVKAWNLRGIVIVVRIKIQKSHHIITKGTLTSFGTERTLPIFSFAGPGTIKQARSNLPKITRKKADSLPN